MKLSRNKLMYGAIIIAIMAWVIYRIIALDATGRLVVYNAARDADAYGAPVETIVMEKQKGQILQPLFIKNNKAVVSASRVGKFNAGQSVGAGEIISVSNRIDLDTGMYVVRTRGAADGLNYAAQKSVGFFVPINSINNNVVMVSVSGVATPRAIKIQNQDSDMALVSAGLSDGDIVILSKTHAGEKVKI